MTQEAHTSDERLALNAWWLIKLRWVAVAGQLATVLGVQFLLGVDLRLPALLAVIAVTAVSNAGLTVWFSRGPRPPQAAWRRSVWQGALGGVMLLDLLSLTALLFFSGGPGNPFTVFYLVNLGLAAMLLPTRWAWFLNGVAILCLAIVFYDHLPVAELQRPERLQTLRAAGYPTLAQQGLFVAFVTCTSVIVYFTTRLTAELQRRESAWRQAEARRARSEHLESLGTMAAGAAHELATPLGTIAVIAKEMERELGAHEPSPQRADQLADDLRMIRAELTRCRSILNRMSVAAGQAVGEAISEWTVKQLVACVLQDLPDRSRVEAVFGNGANIRTLRVPRQGLAQALRGLVQNALDATPSGDRVRILAGCRNGRLQLLIEDSGVGMNEQTLRRAGEPFFTTKEPGKGMGLGLFLARSVIERLDGRLDIESAAGGGTRVLVELPLADETEANSKPIQSVPI